MLQRRCGSFRSGVQCWLVMAALAGVAGRASAQTTSNSPSIKMTPENARVSNYLHDLAGPGALIGVVGRGVLGELGQKNASFDDGDNGLAQRLASRMGQHAVAVSVEHGLAAAMHYSTEYQPCDCHGFGPKVAHAFLETFTDRREDGSRALSVPRIAGAYAGNFARLTWDHSRNAGDAFVGGALSLGFNALFNVARELTGIGR